MSNAYSPLEFASWRMAARFTLANLRDFDALVAQRRLKYFRALSGRIMTAQQAREWISNGYMVLCDVGETLSHADAIESELDAEQGSSFERARR